MRANLAGMRRLAFAACLLFAALPAAVPAGAEPIRTIPDPACAPSYLGTAGVIGMPADPGLGTPVEGGAPAPADVAATLPDEIVFRGNTETFTLSHDFAVRAGKIYGRVHGGGDDWRTIGLPSCLDGRVAQISADGETLLATDTDRWLYTVSMDKASPAGAGWTRRWGPFFWLDFGMQIPADATSWAASDLGAPEDGTFTDRAGNQHEPFGILNLYIQRGDQRTITTLDPWLPSDLSREVCTPDRGTTRIAGMNGSGSTVAIVDADGRISTRLYEFDVAGSNTVFYDYAWEDQRGVANPRVQLPAPDWISHASPPGAITDRISLSKLLPKPTTRLIRIEGRDGNGNTGYWQKPIAASTWSFVRTDLPLRGRALPLPAAPALQDEDLDYTGQINGWDAIVEGFNPYCSPAALRIDFFDMTLDLVLHSIDGLRQERRGRGLDGDARGYRSAIEVPAATWAVRETLPAVVRTFLEQWGKSRFLAGPLTATRSTLRIGGRCWVLRRADIPDDVVASATRDMGALFAGFMAAQEEDRGPAPCTAIYGAP